MPRSFIANMTLFVNASNLLIVKKYLQLAQYIGILEMIVLRISMQGKDIIEHANGKHDVFTL